MRDGDAEGIDPHLDRVAAAMDAEVRAEQAAYEAEALRAERRRRSLGDVARELVVRGDLVEVVVAGQRLRGTPVHAGRDHLALATPRGQVDVALGAMTCLEVLARRPGGAAAGAGPATFRARMTEHEVAASPVVVLLADGGTVEGVVAAAAADHLLLTARRGEVVVPWAGVAAVWPSPTG
jgi:hypothetical protein